jgi:hypothetical protein
MFHPWMLWPHSQKFDLSWKVGKGQAIWIISLYIIIFFKTVNFKIFIIREYLSLANLSSLV